MVNDLNRVSFSYDDVFFNFNYKASYAFLWSVKPFNFGEILNHLPPLKKILVTPLGLNSLLADKVKVMIHLWVLLVKLNNFTFGKKAVLCPQPKAGIEAEAWAELGKNNLRWGLTYFWIKLITAIIFHFGESVKFHLYLTVNYSSGYRSLV